MGRAIAVVLARISDLWEFVFLRLVCMRICLIMLLLIILINIVLFQQCFYVFYYIYEV